MSVSPRILAGRPVSANASAIDWGSHNLVAYGCQSYIVVVEPLTLRVLQTLDVHGGAAVSVVRWCPEGVLSRSVRREGGPAAASGTPGTPGSVRRLLKAAASAAPGALRAVLASGDVSGSILVSDVGSGEVLASFAAESASVVQDVVWHPDDPQVLVTLHGGSQVQLWNVQTREMVGRFRVDEGGSAHLRLAFDPFDATTLLIASSSGNLLFAEGVGRTGCRSVEARLHVRAAAEQAEVGRAMRVVFSPSSRRILFVMLEREILVFDTATQEVVGSVVVDRSRPPLFVIFLCRTYPDLLYCLHVDGSISVLRKVQPGFCWAYQVLCLADMPRGYSAARARRELVAMALCPRSEEKLISLTADGTLTLSRLLTHLVKPQMVVTGVLEPMVAEVHRLSVYMPPVGGSRSANSSMPTEWSLAVASTGGVVHIGSGVQGRDSKRLKVADGPLTALDWIDGGTVLVAASSKASGGNSVRNHVLAVDVASGKTLPLRSLPEPEEAPLEVVELSPLRQFFVVLPKDRPVEMWDLNRTSLLAVLPFSAYCMTWISGGNSPNSATETPTPVAPFSNAPFVLRPHRTGMNNKKERLVLALVDGGFVVCTVGSGEVTTARLDIPPPAGGARISSMAWKGGVLVAADVHGALQRYDFPSEQPPRHSVYTTSRGSIRRVLFAGGRSLQILVHFADGDFGIWNLDHGHRVATSAYLRSKLLDAVDVQWASWTQPVVALSDGSVRVLDSRLTVAQSRIAWASEGPVASPLLLPLRQAEIVRVFLQHGPSAPAYRISASLKRRLDERALEPSHTASPEEEEGPFFIETEHLAEKTPLSSEISELSKGFDSSPWPENGTDSRVHSLKTVDAFGRYKELLDMLEPGVCGKDASEGGVSERCRRAAVFFGADAEEQFWMLAKQALDRSQAYAEVGESGRDETAPALSASSPLPAPRSSIRREAARSALSGVDSAPDALRVEPSSSPLEPRSAGYVPQSTRSAGTVPEFMDILQEQGRIRAYELQRADAQQELCTRMEQRESNAELHTLLGQPARAVDLLLSVSPDHPHFLANCLKACVIGAAVSPELFGQTMRLAASNLIAAGKVDEGVQLLVLIGKGKEACHYLQATGRWRDAAWLAKVALSTDECAVVFKRWAKELLREDRRTKAVHVLLSMGDLAGVLYLLHDMAEYGWAALLADAMEAAGVLAPLQLALARRSDADRAADFSYLCLPSSPPPLDVPLLAIRLRYGDWLAELGLPELAAHYWLKCGDDGRRRLADLSAEDVEDEDGEHWDEIVESEVNPLASASFPTSTPPATAPSNSTAVLLDL